MRPQVELLLDVPIDIDRLSSPLSSLDRVNDSDDLVMTENEVGKIALNIEKEMFNLFQATDNRYKSKYRSIMFNLKDPKNQVG